MSIEAVDTRARGLRNRRSREVVGATGLLFRLDWILLAAFAALVAFGLWAIDGITMHDPGGSALPRQLLYASVGAALFVGILLIDPARYRYAWRPIYYGTLAVMLFVLASAVVEGRAEGAALLIWVGPPDKDALRAAKRAGVPIIALTDDRSVPYVLAEDVVRVPAGQGFPVDAIAHAVARRLGENGTALAAKLPVLRSAVCKELIRSFSKKNGIISAAIFVPGVDMPILTLNQIRLVLRLALAHGQDLDRERAIELAGVVGAGFGFRAIARQLLDFVPFAGWAVKGAIAYTGTRAIGTAAEKYFEARQ